MYVFTARYLRLQILLSIQKQFYIKSRVCKSDREL